MTSEYIIKDGELYHYGVLGMKWGVRKNPSKAYAKAAKKATKLDDEYVKKNSKAVKISIKASTKFSKAKNSKQFEKAVKLQKKSSKLLKDAAKAQRKGSKWVKQMEKQFSEVKKSEISKEHLDAGRKYAYMLMG